MLSSGDVQDNDPVTIFVPLADGIKVQFVGKVANHAFEIGFGVKFEPLSTPQREVLIKLAREAEDAA
jgi:hypothetical protein